MYAKKSLGQHFLMHRQTSERIVLAAGIKNTDTVLEIGPGTGNLTKELLKIAKKVIAVETDAELIPTLEETFASELAEGKLVLIQGDIRTFDPKTIAEPYALVANIPYYITGEIIRLFLTTEHKPISITLLVQKEVAERIARIKKESLLSLSVKAFGTPKYCFTVPKGAFVPAPSVDSAVFSIASIATPFKDTAAEQHFFDVLHAGFAHKRKMLVNNLEAIAEHEKIATAFEQTELSPKIRAEDVSLSKWLALSQQL